MVCGEFSNLLAMNIFAIVLSEDNPEVAQRIGEEYPNSYSLTKTFFLVQSNSIAEDVAVAAGIKGDRKIENARGVVFKLNGSYSGFTRSSLWDWLQQAQEQ